VSPWLTGLIVGDLVVHVAVGVMYARILAQLEERRIERRKQLEEMRR
jgi:hypothetical protein